MSQDVKVIMQYLDSPEADARTIELMLEKGLVSHTAARDLMIVYHYRRVLHEVGERGGANIDVAVKFDVSVDTVKRARKRFSIA